MPVPRKIEDLLNLLGSVKDRQDRIEMLIGIADRFREVPPEVAQRPFDSRHLIPHCESDVYFLAP